MKKNIFITIFFVFCVTNNVFAQNTADGMFHSAANYYVNAQKKLAKQTIQQAIAAFPADAKLRSLAAAIDKLPDENPPDNQNQQQQQQDKQDKQEQQQQQQPKMNKEEAEQLLKALMQDEKQTKENAQKAAKKERNQPEKDW